MRQKTAGKDKKRTVKKANRKPVTKKLETGKAKAIREKVITAVSSEPGVLPFENLFQETSAGVCIFDRDNVAVRCNDQFLRMTGLGSEQIQGKKLRKNMLAGKRGDTDHIRELFEQAKKSLKIVRVNGLAVTLNSGSPRVWNLKALPLLDRKGNYAGMELAIEDSADSVSRRRDKLSKRKRPGQGQAENTIQRLKKEIAELKNSLEELRIREEKYRSMLDEMDEAYYELDDKGNYTFVNETIARQLGYTMEEVKKLNYKDYVPREYWRRTVEAYVDVYRTGVPRRWNPQVNVRKDGKWIYLEDSILPVKNEKGETIGLRGISRDVTERRKAEEEIKKRALLLDSAYDSIIAFDLDGNVIYANESAWRTRGFTHEEILSMNMKQLVPAENAGLVSQRLRLINEAGELTFEAAHIRKDGSVFSVDARARVMDLEGQKIIIAVYSDTTQRKRMESALVESEGKYRSLIESAGAGVASVNLSGELTFVNETICHITGYSKNELIGRPFADFLHPDDRGTLIDRFLEGVKGTLSAPFLEFRLINKAGLLIWFYTAPTELEEEGRVVGFNAIINDVTERKRLEEQLKQSEERYRTIVEEMQESYHETDLKGNYTFATEALARMLGYKGDEIIGLNFREVVSDEVAKDLLGMFNEVYRTGKQNRDVTHQYYRKDGSIGYMENIVSLMRNEKGEGIGFRVVARDVTERKQLEEALRRSEERYRTILEHLQEVYNEVDLKGNYTFVNEAIFPLLGYTREEFIGLNFRAITVTEDIESVKRAFNEVYRTGIPNEGFTYRVIHKDGRILFVETSIALLKDEKGEPIGFSVVGRNVTERNKLEEALKHSEERYRTILEEIQDGYLEVDLAGNVTFSNDQAAEYLGFRGNDFIGVNFRAYTDPDYIQTVFKVFNDVYSTGIPNNGFVFKIRFKDGSSGFVETSVSLLKNQQGEVIGFRGVGRDTTARERLEEALRKSEEKYRTILEQIEDAYFEMDLEGKYTFVNDTFCRNMRYTRDEIIGMGSRDLVHPDDYKDMFKAYLEVFKTGMPNTGVAFRVYTKDGVMGYSENTISPIRNERGDVVGFRSIARNITERKQLEEKLRQSEERYSSIMEEMEDLYGETDLKGNIIYLNDAFLRKLGYKQEELAGKNFREMHQPETADRIFEAFNEVFRTGQPREGLTITFERKDGSTMMYGGRTYIGLLKNSAGEIIGFKSVGQDITEKVKAEEALKESEEKYRNILEQIEDSYFETDVQGNYTFVNDTWCRIMGYTREEVIGQNADKFIHPDDIKQTRKAYYEVYRTGRPNKGVVLRMVHKDGTILYGEASISPMKDKEGNIVGFRSVGRDITERRRLEDNVRRSEERYRSLVEEVEDLYVENDLKGDITFINDAFCRKLGYQPEELLGKSFRILHTGQPQVEARVSEMYRKVYKTGQPAEGMKLTLKRKDGSSMLYGGRTYIGLLKNSTGEIIGFKSVGQDITEKVKTEEALRQYEEKYSSLLEEMDNHYFETDLKGNYIFVNDALCRGLGYSREELIGMNYRKVNHPDSFKPLFEKYNYVYRTGEPHRGFVHKMIRKDGQEVIFEAYVTAAIKDREGKVIGFKTVGHDITEKARTEEAVKRSEERYRSMLEEMGDRYFEVDLDGNFTFVNDAVCRTMGYTREEMIGMSYKKLQVPETGEAVGSVFAEVYRSGVPQKGFVHKVLCKDGSIRLFTESVISLLRNDSGEVIGFKAVGQDITDQVKAEEALKKSEEKYRTVLEEMENYYFEQDLKGTITLASDAVFRNTGFPPEEFIGHYYKEFMPEESAKLIFPVYNRIFQTGEPGKGVVHEVYRKDGTTYMYEEIYIGLMRDEQGKPIGFRSVGQDVTQKMLAERALKESEERYSTLFENTANPILVWDMDGNYLDANAAGLKFLECTREELNKLTVKDTLPLDIDPAAYENLRKTWEAGGTMEREYMVKGKTKLLEITYTPSQLGDKKIIFGIGKDITEHKKFETALIASEERYRLLAENSLDIIWTVDLNMNLTYVSPSVKYHAGFGAEEIINKSRRGIMPEGLIGVSAESMKQVADAIQTIIQDPAKTIILEYEINHPDGFKRWSEVKISVLRGKGGQVAGVLGVSRDITQQKKMTGRLVSADRLASLGEMAAGLAHEVNNPLTAVMGFAYLLLQSPDTPPAVKSDVEAIYREGKRAADVIRNFLIFARGQKPEKQTIYINDLIDGVLRLRKSQIEKENISVKLDLAEDLPAVQGDVSQLQQVFLNIILNGEYFMYHVNKGGTLGIATVAEDNIVKVSITDNGPGIPADKLTRIFDPFYTTKDVGEGTGLGLSICHGIVREHGGIIYAESELGKGTRFTIEIPVNQS